MVFLSPPMSDVYSLLAALSLQILSLHVLKAPWCSPVNMLLCLCGVWCRAGVSQSDFRKHDAWRAALKLHSGKNWEIREQMLKVWLQFHTSHHKQPSVSILSLNWHFCIWNEGYGHFKILGCSQDGITLPGCIQNTVHGITSVNISLDITWRRFSEVLIRADWTSVTLTWICPPTSALFTVH